MFLSRCGQSRFYTWQNPPNTFKDVKSIVPQWTVLESFCQLFTTHHLQFVFLCLLASFCCARIHCLHPSGKYIKHSLHFIISSEKTAKLLKRKSDHLRNSISQKWSSFYFILKDSPWCYHTVPISDLTTTSIGNTDVVLTRKLLQEIPKRNERST